MKVILMILRSLIISFLVLLPITVSLYFFMPDFLRYTETVIGIVSANIILGATFAYLLRGYIRLKRYNFAMMKVIKHMLPVYVILIVFTSLIATFAPNLYQDTSTVLIFCGYAFTIIYAIIMTLIVCVSLVFNKTKNYHEIFESTKA